MIWIEETNGILVKKNSLRFLERDLVLSDVLFVLVLILLEYNIIHMYSVCITL